MILVQPARIVTAPFFVSKMVGYTRIEQFWQFTIAIFL